MAVRTGEQITTSLLAIGHLSLSLHRSAMGHLAKFMNDPAEALLRWINGPEEPI
jgi:hypothetical protein